MIEGKVIITKSWRSELPGLCVYVVLLFAAPILSDYLPGTSFRGPLFSFGDSTVYLWLTFFWLMPLVSLLYLISKMYDVWYVVDRTGIEAWSGILSLRQQITRLRHEDIRSIETDQSVIERLLDVGRVSVATAAIGEVEVMFRGVASPKALQTWLQAERDEVQKRLRRKIEDLEKFPQKTPPAEATNFLDPTITTTRETDAAGGVSFK